MQVGSRKSKSTKVESEESINRVVTTWKVEMSRKWVRGKSSYPSRSRRQCKSKLSKSKSKMQVEVYPSRSRSRRQCKSKLSKSKSKAMQVEVIQVEVEGNASRSYPSRSRRQCKSKLSKSEVEGNVSRKLSKSKIKMSNRDSHTRPFYTFY
jgi:hypothetical protein